MDGNASLAPPRPSWTLQRKGVDSGGPEVGDACTADSSCPSGGVCATGWPGGYCTQDCQTSSCPSGSVCVAVTGGSVCLTSCPEPGTQSTCRDGYSCAELKSGGGVCAPAQ